MDCYDCVSLAKQHLLLKLKRINRLLTKAISAQIENNEKLALLASKADCITNEEVNYLLKNIAAIADEDFFAVLPVNLSSEEEKFELELKAQAKSQGWQLPLQAMMAQLNLSMFEMDVLLLCIAPYLSSEYGKLYAFLHDDFHKQLPSLDLLCRLSCYDQTDYFLNTLALAEHANLRRLKLIEPVKVASMPLQQEFRARPELFEQLLKFNFNWRSYYYDSNEIKIPARMNLKVAQKLLHSLDLQARVEHFKHKKISILGLWGKKQADLKDIVMAIAISCGLPVRRISGDITQLKQQLDIANLLHTIVWIDIDQFTGCGESDQQLLFLEQLKNNLLYSANAIVLTGIHAWRPSELLCHQAYAEKEISVDNTLLRSQTWLALLPELSCEQAQSFSLKYQFSREEIEAAKNIAVNRSQIKSDVNASCFLDYLDYACCLVSRPRPNRFCTLIKPKRDIDDLVLTTAVKQQVVEVARFYKSLHLVNESWGFATRLSGQGGMKVLFTGDSGTGKTLAAEVIAKQIGLPLLKVDLAEIVSKWVGETEKNIDETFNEAEASNAVLFFDEADSLFAKRAEVKQSSDRYGNLQVGQLLQKLEDFRGLAVLASNLKDEIDQAFLRRFNVVLHFPRPSKKERTLLWSLAFPKNAPLAANVDLNAYSHLDMTGANIFSAAHTAALIAADEKAAVISETHIAEGISRQYLRESRLVSVTEIKGYVNRSMPASS